MTSLLQTLPLRDAASRHLLKHPDGSPLYPGGALLSGTALQRRAKILETWDGNRSELARWLAAQNGFAPLHAAQAEHLKAASQSDSLFVLTGQQPGMLGGPALWFCKAMTCAAHARRCAQALDRPVIPIFWVAGDDSDVAESARVEWLEPEAEVPGTTMDFPEAGASIPMSLRIMSESALGDLFRIPQGLWSEETFSLARKCYQPGRSVTGAFLRLAQSLLGPEGILFVDGLSAAERGRPFLTRLAREGQVFHRSLWQGTRRLGDTLSLPPQVTPRGGTLPLFMLEQGQRIRLFSSDGAANKTRIFAQGAEGRDVSEGLESLSLLPTALSRPLMAETLFPVLGHVLGPAELRYFAQLSDAFPALGLSFPPLLPRQQALLLARKEWKRLAGLGMNPDDLPEFSPSRLRSRLSARLWSGNPASADFPEGAFTAFDSSIRDYQNRFFPGSREMESAGRMLEKGFGRYREAAKRALFAAEGADTHASFRPLLRWLGNGSQDRHLNVLSLRNALGAGGFSEWTDLLRTGAPAITVSLYGEEA